MYKRQQFGGASAVSHIFDRHCSLDKEQHNGAASSNVFQT